MKWGPLVEGDIRDTEALVATLRAAPAQGGDPFRGLGLCRGKSVTAPAKYYSNNVEGTLSLLEACRIAGVGSVIFSSSCATYGSAPEMPIVESTVQAPINPYGWTKLIGEQMLMDYAAAYGIRFSALRYFNACGPTPKARSANGTIRRRT